MNQEGLARRVGQLTNAIEGQYKAISAVVMEGQGRPQGIRPDIIYDQLRWEDKDPLVLLTLTKQLIINLYKFNCSLLDSQPRLDSRY